MSLHLRLKDKMTLWYTLLTFLTVVAFACALYFMTNYVLGEILEQNIHLSMQQLTAQIENKNGLVTFDEEVPVSTSIIFTITKEDGSKIASYGNDITLFDHIQAEPDVFSTAQGTTERWLILESGLISVDDFQIQVRIAGSLSTNDRVLSAMRMAFFISIPLIVLLSVLGGFMIANRSLAPIRQIIHSANRIAQGDLSARIPTAPAKDELGELTDTLNHMLQSVEETFQREKRFTSDASHELRMPVAVILAYVESMRAEKDVTQENAASLDTVIAECSRMQKIIAHLLTITRVEEGRYPIYMETVHLRAVAEGVAETLAASLKARDITLSIDIDGALTCQADQSLITEVLLNLTENAIKYGKHGGHVDLKAQRRYKEIEIQIRDDGIGISPENLPHIFERFFRADSARDRSGTGLGLSIVQWIVKVHHGEISVQSTPGVGSVFTITLLDDSFLHVS